MIRKFVLAAALAAGGLMAAAPAQPASAGVYIGVGGPYYGYHRPHYRPYYRPYYRPAYRPYGYYRPAYGCRTVVRTYWDHGRRVTVRKRAC